MYGEAAIRDEGRFAQRQVTVVVFPGVQALDVVGPLDVFDAADRLLGGGGYSGRLLGPSEEVRASGGLALRPNHLFGESDDERDLDTLIVPGGFGVGDALRDEALVGAVRSLAPQARRVASVCTGAFVLAEAGLLEGRRATTHWAAAGELARLHPGLIVEADRLHVTDGKVSTSAGVTAGMDLALALIEQDHGRSLALEVARWLVMFLQRSGGQAQFSAQLSAQMAERDVLRELQVHVAEHPAEDLSVAAMARRARMSERNFARAFVREVGVSPARYVRSVRVEAARRKLEQTGRPVKTVARECGFASDDAFRRAFERAVGVAPDEYRRRFKTGPSAKPSAAN